MSTSETTAPDRASNHERTAMSLGVLLALIVMVGPLILIANLPAGELGSGAKEATVGVAVILRATARRLIRSGAGTIMRSSVGTVSRASARTATRQLLKFSTRAMTAATARDAATELEGASKPSNPVAAVGIGTVALMLSFWGVLLLAGDEVVNELTAGGTALYLIIAMSGAPLPVYAAFAWFSGRRLGVSPSFETKLDGLLMQAYFTGSGSFLPMTTDVTYGSGTDVQQAKTSAWAIGGTYLVHLALAGLAAATGSDALAYASAFMLVYAFIYVFPIKPLEGHDVWKCSKLAWLALALPPSLSFVLTLRESVAGTL